MKSIVRDTDVYTNLGRGVYISHMLYETCQKTAQAQRSKNTKVTRTNKDHIKGHLPRPLFPPKMMRKLAAAVMVTAEAHRLLSRLTVRILVSVLQRGRAHRLLIITLEI